MGTTDWRTRLSVRQSRKKPQLAITEARKRSVTTSPINPDTDHMQRALTLAAKAEGHVEPNPMVGAVIVKEGVILGEGYHQKFGGPHAEIEALKACTADPQGATLYVTLEPCCHHGKTPPCTHAIIRAGIKRVVVALKDPFPQVAGNGIAVLRAANIEVEVGLLQDQATYLLAPYLKRIQTGKPWVIAKWAMTLDGKIAAADGSSKWITSDAARAIGHQLRGPHRRHRRWRRNCPGR